MAGGYRLAAVHEDDYPLCGRHLGFDWRLFTAYLDDGRIVEVALDRHTPARNPIDDLAEALPSLATVGRRRESKPPCCEDPEDPPPMNDELRDFLGAL